MTTLTIPIFPLQTPVLFPTCATPLHVFEPRYRAMLADALASERRIGMVTVRPEALREMAGDPPIFPVGCAGFVAQHQRLADGRSLIVLQATSRFRVTRELPRGTERAYRVADVELLGEALGDEALLRAQRSEVARQLDELLAESPERSADLDLEWLAGLDPASFANQLCQAIRLPPPEKQALLEAETIAARLQLLSQTLAFHQSLAGRAGQHTLH